jgi:pimaricinolide synthase PimS1
LTAELGAADLARLSRSGLMPLSVEAGLGFLDRARSGSEPVLFAAPVDVGALRKQAAEGTLPAILSGLVTAARRRRRGDGLLTRRLTGLSEAEREALVLSVVREHVAAVLGLDPAKEIDDDQPLLEIGLDSLGAVELRNRLADAAVIPLPTTVVFDHPTPADLARHLAASMTGRGGGVVTGDSPHAAGGTTLRALLVGAHGQGKADEILPLLSAAARFHPTFDSADEFDPPQAMRITEAGTAPRLICVPSFVVGSGPHQFVRIARALEGRRAVSALSLPGVGRGQRLPATWGAMVDVLAASVREAATGEPFVVVGYSSGWLIARALVECLEQEGPAPSGLIEIDAQVPREERAAVFATVIGRLIEMDHEAIAIDDDHLIAMGAYIRLCDEWQPGPLAAPELALRAGEGLDADGEEDERAVWRRPEETVEVAGDHFELIAQSADATAEAIERWVSKAAGQTATSR